MRMSSCLVRRSNLIKHRHSNYSYLLGLRDASDNAGTCPHLLQDVGE